RPGREKGGETHAGEQGAAGPGPPWHDPAHSPPSPASPAHGGTRALRVEHLVRMTRIRRLLVVAVSALVLVGGLGAAQAVPVTAYAQAEYFVSGTANDASTGQSAPYTTRIIVTRPADPKRFNGTVLLDWVNVTAQFENAVDTLEAHRTLTREGFAVVHASVQ